MARQGGSYLIKKEGDKPVLQHRTKTQAEANAEVTKKLTKKEEVSDEVQK